MLQVKLQANQPQPTIDNNGSLPSPVEDDIDAALNNLQTTLEGSSLNTFSNDITQVPELKDQLRFLKDLHLYMYKSREEMMHGQNAVFNINLKGCEVTPDVNISQNKYVIKLEVPSSDGMSEMYIRCDEETQYARWMACCRLAAKGRSLADSSYESEKQTILDFLNLQKASRGTSYKPKQPGYSS
ncbi:hypothetical protein NQ314_003732 [Rhamnusium bicolor]|uniref:PH domain-containing protein n=1 Tax=Rhamnusium bicolor TaxID=1586634 RepID=A0AAV8ZP14_9CUCU|nr:hypothetical protein NQ314_003732 [Rhamnusium bicolor]